MKTRARVTELSYDKAGNPIRRTEMGFGITNSFNNLNQIGEVGVNP